MEVPLLGDDGVAGGVEGVLGVEFGFLDGAQGVVAAGDFVEAVFGFDGAPVGDDLDGEVGVDVFLYALRGQTGFAGSSHGVSFGWLEIVTVINDRLMIAAAGGMASHVACL